MIKKQSLDPALKISISVKVIIPKNVLLGPVRTRKTHNKLVTKIST